MIFYLGFISIIIGLFYDNKTKSNMACGQLISNLLFMAYTIVYFLIFYAMMHLTTSDEVLTVNRITAEAGSPTWVILAVIVVSILYLVVMYKHIVFCFKNFRDMGYEMYSQVASSIVSAVKDSAVRTGDNIKNFFSKDDNTSTTSTSTSSLSGTGIMNTESTTDVNITEGSSNVTVNNRDDIIESGGASSDMEYSHGYDFNTVEEQESSTSSADIDAMIDAGSSGESDS